MTCELVEELQVKTKEFLQPNPTARAKMAAVKGISKLSGQAKSNTYPQPEGVLGDCMLIYGRKLGDDSPFGLALVEMGESLKQMADVKYSLDDNIKQNFLEPLHHLQTKDLKEVMVGRTFSSFSFYLNSVCFFSTIGKNYRVEGSISTANAGDKLKVCTSFPLDVSTWAYLNNYLSIFCKKSYQMLFQLPKGRQLLNMYSNNCPLVVLR